MADLNRFEVKMRISFHEVKEKFQNHLNILYIKLMNYSSSFTGNSYNYFFDMKVIE